jgi:hypothetical protein
VPALAVLHCHPVFFFRRERIISGRDGVLQSLGVVRLAVAAGAEIANRGHGRLLSGKGSSVAGVSLSEEGGSGRGVISGFLSGVICWIAFQFGAGARQRNHKLGERSELAGYHVCLVGMVVLESEEVSMKFTPIIMSGTATFNTFSYLLNGAHSFLLTAKEHSPGSKYCRVSAVLFSAFAVEAHLNHIGEIKLAFWQIVEPKLGWRYKFELIAQQLEIEIDSGKRPFQTLVEVFKFRDRLAHGKTTTQTASYEDRGNPRDGFDCLDPDWLKKYWTDETAERVFEDAREIIERFHMKAGFPKQDVGQVSTGSFSEQSKSE